jgi:ribosome biogenesis protein Tsr3
LSALEIHLFLGKNEAPTQHKKEGTFAELFREVNQELPTSYKSIHSANRHKVEEIQQFFLPKRGVATFFPASYPV